MGAVCRWVSGYGWAQGVRHITSPTDLRERVGHGEIAYILYIQRVKSDKVHH